METFIVHPDRNGPHPVVIMLMDAPGIREELYDMARRLCSVGYYVVLPNLYYRAGRDTKYGPDVTTKGSAEQARMRAVRTKMTIPPVMDDFADMLAFVDTQPAAKNGLVGTHGYCMSGPYSLAAAARYPDRVAAAASSYGTWLVSENEESPHLTLAKAKGELYIACAEHDELAPLPMVAELKALFDKSGNGGELEITRRPPRFRVPDALVLRQTGGGAALGASDRAVLAAIGVAALPQLDKAGGGHPLAGCAHALPHRQRGGEGPAPDGGIDQHRRSIQDGGDEGGVFGGKGIMILPRHVLDPKSGDAGNGLLVGWQHAVGVG